MAFRRLSICRGVVRLALGLALVSGEALGQGALPQPVPEAAPAAPPPPPSTPVVAPVGGAAGLAETAPDTAFPPRPLRPPADAVAAAAYAVLDKHCARCHQGGKLERPAPSAAFGNILRLDEVASSPHLVQPGNPDASRLYVMMLRRLMPLDVHAPGTDKSEKAAPSPDEIAAVRSWISALPPHQQCRDRRFVTPADHAATLSQLTGLTGENPTKLRFVSIAHLHNGCVRFEALAASRLLSACSTA